MVVPFCPALHISPTCTLICILYHVFLYSKVVNLSKCFHEFLSCSNKLIMSTGERVVGTSDLEPSGQKLRASGDAATLNGI